MLNRPDEYRRMAAVEGEHWWYRSLHHLVVSALETHPLGRQVRVLDAGCGTGGLLRFLRERGYCHLAGFDISPEAVSTCRERRLRVEHRDLRECPQSVPLFHHDVIISNDTLYFFAAPERHRIVESLWGQLAPGGLLILNLPACAGFRGIHDLSVGIQHRFTKQEAMSLFSKTAFDQVRSRYWPFALSPLIYLARMIQRERLRRAPFLQPTSDLRLPPRVLNKLMEWITRLENRALPWKPVGSSLFVVGRKRS